MDSRGVGQWGAAASNCHAPDCHAPDCGDSTTSRRLDGRDGWHAAPHAPMPSGGGCGRDAMRGGGDVAVLLLERFLELLQLDAPGL